jgi:hypothetical protein
MRRADYIIARIQACAVVVARLQSSDLISLIFSLIPTYHIMHRRKAKLKGKRITIRQRPRTHSYASTSLSPQMPAWLLWLCSLHGLVAARDLDSTGPASAKAHDDKRGCSCTLLWRCGCRLIGSAQIKVLIVWLVFGAKLSFVCGVMMLKSAL